MCFLLFLLHVFTAVFLAGQYDWPLLSILPPRVLIVCYGLNHRVLNHSAVTLLCLSWPVCSKAPGTAEGRCVLGSDIMALYIYTRIHTCIQCLGMCELN